MIEPLHHVSASQIETFELCERKWYFKSVMHLPTPEGAGAKLGKATHEDIEGYLRGDKPASALGTLARRVYDRGLLPKPGTVHVEHAIESNPQGPLTVAGVALIGFIDVLDTGSDRLAVIDWKTRGDVARHSKTEEQLLTDIQLNIYGAEAFRADDLMVYQGAPFAHARRQAVDVSHVNIGTKPPNLVTVSGPVTLTRKSVAAFFTERIEPAVTRMVQVALLPTPMRVTPNIRACSAFGGCPFRDKCNADQRVSSIPSTPTPVGASTMSTPNKESIMARLRTGGAPAPTPAAENTNPVRPPDAPASGAKAALLARLNANKGADVTTPTPEPAAPATPPPAVNAPVSESERKPRGHQEKLAALGYTPEQVERMTPATMRRAIEGKIDAKTVSISKLGELVIIPTRAPEPVTKPRPGVEAPALDDLDSCVKFALEGLGWSDAEIDAMPDEMLVFVAEKAVCRGNVDLVIGADGKIADIEEKPAPPPPVVAPAPLRLQDRANTTTADVPPFARDGAILEALVLYIGCRPVKGAHARAAVALEDYLAPLCRAVAADAKVEHYTMIDYAQGPARVAALVLRDPPKGVFVCDRTLPASAAVLEVLRPLADFVIVAGA